MVAQVYEARIERLIVEIRKIGYHPKHRERMAHSHDVLLKLEVIEKEIPSRIRRVKVQED